MTNSDFLAEIYGEMEPGTHGWVCSFRADPSNAPPTVWAGRAYKGLPNQAALIDRSVQDNTYFCTSVLTATADGEIARNKAAFVRHARGFGNAGRNIIEGPGFQDVDFSVSKTTHIKEGINVQFRAEVFNILNHPNFAQPTNSFTSADFGRITATRTARGDLGSSRQLQLGLKMTF